MIPLVVASETGIAWWKYQKYFSRMSLERTTKEGNSPVDEKIYLLYNHPRFNFVKPKKYHWTREIQWEENSNMFRKELYEREDRLPRLNIFHDR